MKELFEDILEIDNVEGVMLVSFEGEVIYQEFSWEILKNPEKNQKVWWAVFADSLNGIREADAVFEDRRLYIRKTEPGYLIVVMEIYAPIAMVRLHADIIMPKLKKKKSSKGLMGFFKKN
jgi:hypothetical protein